MADSQRPRVIVIGAGIAGLAAADRLRQSGAVEVVLLEAGDRVGGRVHTHEISPGQHVEMGAQWIHGIGGSPVYELAKEKGLMAADPDDDEPEEDSEDEEEDWDLAMVDRSLIRTNNGLAVDKKLRMSVGRLYRQAIEQCKSQVTKLSPGGKEDVGSHIWHWFQEQASFASTAEHISELVLENGEGMSPPSTPEEDQRLKEAIFRTREKLECNIAGCESLGVLSLQAYGNYKEFPGQHLQIPGGYQNVAKALAERLPAGALKLGKQVERICWGEGAGVTVKCSGGEDFAAEHVIVTVSLGVLKERAAAAPPNDAFAREDADTLFLEASTSLPSPRTTFFDPPLPEWKQAAIRRMGFGVVDKLYLDFEKPVLPAKCERLETVWVSQDEELEPANKWARELFGMYPPPRLPRCLVAWLHGGSALEVEGMTEETLQRSALQTLERFLPELTGHKRRSQLKQTLRSSWGLNPLFRGSYSYVATGSSDADVDILAAPLSSPSDSPPRQTELGVEAGSSQDGDAARQPTVLFAGEATCPQFYSTTHGAWLSGLREADRLVRVVSDSRKGLDRDGSECSAR